MYAGEQEGPRLTLLECAVAGLFGIATPAFAQIFVSLCIGLFSWSFGYTRITMRHEFMLCIRQDVVDRTFGTLHGVGLLCAALGAVRISKYAARAGFKARFQAAYRAYRGDVLLLATVGTGYLLARLALLRHGLPPRDREP